MSRFPSSRPPGSGGTFAPVFAGVVALSATLSAALPAAAQIATGDVEMLGRIHGTTPPAAYYEELQRDPGAYRFSVEGPARLEALGAASRQRFPHLVPPRDGIAHFMGPRDPVVGTFAVPLVLGNYADGPVPTAYDRDRIQREFFDGPNSRGATITEFYAEMSRGLLDLEGTTFDWVRTPITRANVTLGAAGLTRSATVGVGAFIEAIVAELDAAGMDWSPFDLTGNGYVDLLTVFHPDRGAECGGAGQANRIWSHRWTIQSVTNNRLPNGIRTATPGPGPDGFIHIQDYTIQPLLDCSGQAINEIGVFAHEIGHGFGLPDLYDTIAQAYTAVGRWDLMGTGAWGCEGVVPAFPCQMGAWSKMMLGWVEVEDIPVDTDVGEIILPPVQTSGRVLRIPAGDGSPYHLLLENRQRIGGDAGLVEPGLLIWQVREQVIQGAWPQNLVNAFPSQMGLLIRTASGRGNLEMGGVFHTHGSPGDPYPGCIKASLEDYLRPSVPCEENDRFDYTSLSPARLPDGGPIGVRISEIRRVGPEPFDIAMNVNTRWSRIHLAAISTDGSASPSAAFRADGASVAGPVLAAPEQQVTIEAPGGAEIADGVRVGFDGWTDGEPRIRTFIVGPVDTTLVASYSGEEVRLGWTTTIAGGHAGGQTPGDLLTVPVGDGGWFPRGTTVLTEVRPRTGFRFLNWVGALSGSSNVSEIVLDEPREVGAHFEVSYGFDDPPSVVPFPAAEDISFTFALNDANPPVFWTIPEGELPPGLQLGTITGTITGVALEVGSFDVRIQALEATGLVASIQLRFEVAPPTFSIDDLLAPWFGTGSWPPVPLRNFLDHNGNRDGFYDLGDLRAYLHRFGVPGGLAAVSAELRPVIERIIQMGPLHEPPPDGGER